MGIAVYPRSVPQKYSDAAAKLFARGPAILRDQFGESSDMKQVRSVPEFLFLGSTNAGKSSVLSSLLSPPRSIFPRSLPRVSKRQGFTRTLSAWTIGDQLRLLDSPGYGFKSKAEQGLLVSRYLEKFSPNVVKAYILAPVQRGIASGDISVIDMLSRYGVPFTFVFTKCDLLREVNLESLFKQSCDAARECGAVPPGEAFAVSALGKKPFGIRELRGDIYASSGLAEIKSISMRSA